MHITIDVNVKGLEILVPILERLAGSASIAPVATHAPLTVVPPVQPAQVAQPVAAPVAMPAAAPVQMQAPATAPAPGQAPIMGAAIPVAAPTYSMEQLAVAATQLVDAGRRNELVTLLNSFGVPALTALAKEQYGNFATQLRAMGAKI